MKRMMTNNEEEEFECYPPGMKVQVRYGRGKNQKMYEASIKDLMSKVERSFTWCITADGM